MQHTADNQCAATQSMQVVKRLRAFTLVELLIVVVILGILATVVVPMFSGAATDAKLATLQHQLRAVRSALNYYNLDHTGVVGAPAEGESCEGIPWLTDKSCPNGCGVTGLAVGPCCSCLPEERSGTYLLSFPSNPFASQGQDQVQWGGEPVYEDVGWFIAIPDPLFGPISFRSNWDEETAQY